MLKSLPFLISALALTACMEKPYIDTSQEEPLSHTKALEEQTITVTRNIAALSINETLTNETYDGLLNELRQLNLMPLAGLPGNVVLVAGDMRRFNPGALSIPTTVHQRTSDQQWTLAVDTEAVWHRQLNGVEVGDMPISQEDVHTIQEKVSTSTNRALSFRIAAKVIDRYNIPQPPSPPPKQQVGDVFSMTDDLKNTTKTLTSLLNTPEKLPKTTSVEQAQRELQWTKKRINTLTSSQQVQLIQGPKFAINRTTLAVFFPESTNTGNENWSASEIEDQLTELTLGVSTLITVAPQHTNLFFDYVIYGLGNHVNNISVEPTYFGNEFVWIDQLLHNAGIPNSILGHYAHNLAYETVIAQSTNAAHATSVFIVRDEEAPFAEFNHPHMTSWPHAIFNGYYVTTSRFGSHTHVHELLHTYNAPDQYSGGFAIDPCQNVSPHGHDRTVWAGAPASTTNGNHITCGAHATQHASIMAGWNINNNYGTQNRPSIDWYSRASIGWGNTTQLLARTEVLNPNNLAGVHDPAAFVRIGNLTQFADDGDNDEALAFRYVNAGQAQAVHFPTCMTKDLTIGSWVSAPNIWFPQGMSITPYAYCDSEMNNVAQGIAGGAAEIDVAAPTIPSAQTPQHEGHVEIHTQVYEPAAQINMDCTAVPFWTDGFAPIPLTTPMGCFVRKPPVDTHAFIWSNNYYVKYHDFCPQGTPYEDSCIINNQLNSGPFYLATSSDQKQGLLVNQLSPTHCPVGNYWFTVQNSAVCVIATATPDTLFFIDNQTGALLSTQKNGCSVGVDDSANCYLGTPPAGKTAKLDGHRFYYLP